MSYIKSDDIGDYHVQIYRIVRIGRRIIYGLKIIGCIVLALFAVIAFICHEYERASHRRH